MAPFSRWANRGPTRGRADGSRSPGLLLSLSSISTTHAHTPSSHPGAQQLEHPELGVGPPEEAMERVRPKGKGLEGRGPSLLCPFPLEIPGRWITRSPPPEGADSTAPSTQEPEVPPEQDLIASTMADVVTTVMGSSQPVLTRGTTDNLIPVYCSILAAVVVGLVAYIAFKR